MIEIYFDLIQELFKLKYDVHSTEGNAFRALMYDVTQHHLFKRIIVFLVIANCLMLSIPVSRKGIRFIVFERYRNKCRIMICLSFVKMILKR